MNHTILSGLSLFAFVAYLGFDIASIVKLRAGKLADLMVACQHAWTALALAGLELAIELVLVPADGLIPPVIWLFNILMCAVYVRNVGRQRDRKAREAAADQDRWFS